MSFHTPSVWMLLLLGALVLSLLNLLLEVFDCRRVGLMLLE